MKKGKNSQCLSWSADILELWLLNLLRATSANTSEVLLNSSCLVCVCCGGMDKFQLPASVRGGLKKHWWIVHDFEKLVDCEGGLGNLFLPSCFRSSNLACGFQHMYQCFFSRIHLKKKKTKQNCRVRFLPSSLCCKIRSAVSVSRSRFGWVSHFLVLVSWGAVWFHCDVLAFIWEAGRIDEIHHRKSF